MSGLRPVRIKGPTSIDIERARDARMVAEEWVEHGHGPEHAKHEAARVRTEIGRQSLNRLQYDQAKNLARLLDEVARAVEARAWRPKPTL